MFHIKEIINSIFSSKTYIVFKEEQEKAWLVDVGDIDPIVAFMNEHHKVVAGVFLTHGHFDHIYGLPDLLKLFPDCRIYTNAIGLDTLANPKRNLSLYHENPIKVEGPQIFVCREGDAIPLFSGVTAKVYETTGHHPSCLSFLVGDYLFTGDAYIPGIKTVTNLPGGNKEKSKESGEKILELSKGKIICPGHESVSSCVYFSL